MLRARIGRVLLKRLAVLAAMALPVAAQTPAPSPDAPSVKIGGTIFADYTYQAEPSIVDAGGDRVDLSTFNITRAYINVTGNLNRRLQYRITPDIARETGSGSSLSGSYTFRLKYAFGQLNLDEWTTPGSWVRFGMQQMPYNDLIESFYRYRFQGPLFGDREGYIGSSDFGISGRWVFPGDYGDVHAGIYNGEGFQRAEVNDQKSVQARVGFRPLPRAPFWKGLTFGAYLNGDNYVADEERRRFAPYAVLATRWVTVGAEGLRTRDRQVDGEGFSLWATPKLTENLELLARHDSLKPDTNVDARKSRDILGVAYWIPNLQRVSSAVMIDGERVEYDHMNRSDETRYAVHVLVNF
jgi:hypothetical protein